MQKLKFRLVGFHQGHCLRASACLPHFPAKGGEGSCEPMSQSNVRSRYDCGSYRRGVILDGQDARRCHKVPGSVPLVHVSLHGPDTDHHSFAMQKSFLDSTTHLYQLLLTARSMQRRQKKSALQSRQRLGKIVQGVLYPVLQRSTLSRLLESAMHKRSHPHSFVLGQLD